MDSVGVGAPYDHAVSFYDHDFELLSEVARFVVDGLARDQRVIVMATAQRAAALDEALVPYDPDAARARTDGRYLTYDAAEMLATIMIAGAPDRAQFLDAVGAIIDAVGADGSPIRVFGEMVALLWHTGNLTGAVELETLWNQLAVSRRFSLLCAYPSAALADATLDETNRVCGLHSNVLAPRSYSTPQRGADRRATGAVHSSHAFVPVPAAVPAARRFVEGTLRAWGEHELLARAALVTSELATNAIEHAASAFRVRVHRAGPVVRIGVEDVRPTPPQLRAAEVDHLGGRGVAIVGKLAQSWGCDVLPHGKIVWADLTAQRSQPSG